MQSDLVSDLEKCREFLANRTTFPVDELAKYSGEWIVWSPDGARIVAHASDPRGLDDLIHSLGEDPDECLVEGIPVEASLIGHMEREVERA